MADFLIRETTDFGNRLKKDGTPFPPHTSYYAGVSPVIGAHFWTRAADAKKYDTRSQAERAARTLGWPKRATIDIVRIETEEARHEDLSVRGVVIPLTKATRTTPRQRLTGLQEHG